MATQERKVPYPPDYFCLPYLTLLFFCFFLGGERGRWFTSSGFQGLHLAEFRYHSWQSLGDEALSPPSKLIGSCPACCLSLQSLFLPRLKKRTWGLGVLKETGHVGILQNQKMEFQASPTPPFSAQLFLLLGKISRETTVQGPGFWQPTEPDAERALAAEGSGLPQFPHL